MIDRYKNLYSINMIENSD